MSQDFPGPNATRASALIAGACTDVDSRPSKADGDMLRAAVEQDLDAASQNAVHDEERLAKIESQVRLLADAIIVITAPSDSVDGAVKAVKDKM